MYHQPLLSHMKDMFWCTTGGCVIICQGLSSAILYAGLVPPQGNDPEASTSEEVSVQFVFSCFSFEKTARLAFGATWKYKPVLQEWDRALLCVMRKAWKRFQREGWGVGGCCWCVYVCACACEYVYVCAEGFLGGHPSCQSCLASISGLFRGVNTPVQQTFCLRVRPRLPPSDSRTQCQRAENTPCWKHILES